MAFSLGGILNFKKLGFGGKSQSVVGIDIGSSSIKAVQLRREHGKAILETYGEIALGPYGDLAVGQATNLSSEKITEALKDLFREANITTRRAAVSIPLKSSLLKVVELPSFDEKQLNQMVPIEARKYIPVPISEVALDWWVIPKQDFQEDREETLPGAPATVEVLIVAIHNGTIKKYQDIAHALSLEASIFEVETFSAIRSLLTRDISASVIIDIGASTTKMSIIDYGIVKVSHTINRGSQDVTVALGTSLGVPFDQAEQIKRRDGLQAATQARAVGISNSVSGESTTVMNSALEFIFYEANRVLLDYERKYSRLVTKIMLVGGGALLKGLLPVASKSFESSVVLGESFRSVEAPAFLADVLSQAGPEFSIAVGLALRELEQS